MKLKDFAERLQAVDRLIADYTQMPNDKLECAKLQCTQLIDRYINSRGKLLFIDKFSPTLKTLLFRDTELTKLKIAKAQELKNHDQKRKLRLSILKQLWT